MARYRLVDHLVGLLLLVCTTAALRCPDQNTSPGRELVCYTSTASSQQLENAICRCTTLVHEGHDLQNLETSEVEILRKTAKDANPGIRVLISISDKYGLLKNSVTSSQDAVNYLSKILDKVDGVELNLTAGSRERLVTLVKGLKDEMVNRSIDRMILLALPTKPEDLAKQFELKELSKYVDIFTAGTHYLRDEAYRTFHPSRLMGLFDMLNTDSLVDLIIGMGAPKQKILISAPAGAYKFTLKKAEDNTPRSSAIKEQPVLLGRKKMCEEMSEGEWTVERDEDLTAPYAFRNTSWIAFEDETSLKIKGKYAILRELAGIGLRNIENDEKNNCGISVAQAVQKAFMSMKRKTRELVLSSLEKDLKGTDISYPRHIRSSDFRIVRVIDTQGKIRAIRENTQTAFTCNHQGYFVHPRSCNRFYRCVKFNQEKEDYSVFEFDCPAGLAFDEKTEVCVWPGSLSSGSACPGSSEIEPVSRGRFRCPDRPGFYADPHNCRWFFACYDLGGPEMVPYEFRCPFGLVFDEHKLICEWPWKVPNCNSPGYNDGHSIYNFGGTYEGQYGSAVHSGNVGQGEIIDHGSYAGQIGGINAYDGQSGQYDYGGSAYDEQTYSAGGGVNYNGQAFNAGSFGNGGAYNGQTHIDTGIKYDGQSYHGTGTGTGYNTETHNSAGAGYDSPIYHTAGGNVDYGKSQNTGGFGGAGLDYDGQNYDTQSGAGVDIGHHPVFIPNIHHDSNYNSPIAPISGADYSGQSYNGDTVDCNQPGISPGYLPGTGTAYDGQHFNNNGAFPETDKDATFSPNGGQNFNNDGVSPEIGKGVTVSPNAGQNVNIAGADNDSGIPVSTADYEDRGGVTANGHIGQGNLNINTADVKPTQFNSQTAGSTIGLTDFAGVTRIPSGFTVTDTHFTGGAGLTNDFAAGTANFAGGAGSTTGYSAGATNYAGEAGSTADFSGTNTFGGVANTNYPGSTVGANNFGQTDYSKVVTNQNNLNTGGLSTAYEGGNNDFPKNTNFNSFDSNAGISTVGFVNTIDGKTNTGDTGATQYIGTNGLNILNSTYDATAGYPSSTILPFADRQNTDTVTYEGMKPVNSVVYQSQLDTGLSPVEEFGIQYSNEAVKSFICQGQTPPGFAPDGCKQNNQIFYNVKNPFYKPNLVGATSSSSNGGNTYNTAAGITNYGTTNTFFNQGPTVNQNSFTGSSAAVTPTTVQNFNKQGEAVPGVVPLSTIRPVVEFDNSGLSGISTPSSISPQTNGYQTNEYFDNRGRGTIKYNIDENTNKVTQNAQDFGTTSYTKIPDSFIINSGTNDNEQSTIMKLDNNAQVTDGVYTREGFTKTGPTKTGITTAQVGGSGSYVIGTGVPRARPNPLFIGEQAFSTNIDDGVSDFNAVNSVSNAGTTNFNSGGSTTNYGTTSNFGTGGNTANFGTSDYASGVTATDYSTANQGQQTYTEDSGYSYAKPLVQLESDKPSTIADVTQTNYIQASTPISIPNIQTLEDQNPIIKLNTNEKGSVSTTVTPIGYTANQLDNFKTTVYQSVGLPQAVSTVRPVIDTGSKTVIYSTPVPIIINTQKGTYQTDHLPTTPQSYLGIGVSFDQGEDYYSSVSSQTGSSDYSDITSNFDQGTFGQKITDQTRITNYQKETTNPQTINLNNDLIKVTPDGYNSFAQTGVEANAQTDFTRKDRINNFKPIVVTPKQIYLPSSTLTPPSVGIFGKPIIAATISQNSADFLASQKSSNRILNNQASSGFVKGTSSDQASGNYASRGSVKFNQGPDNSFSNDHQGSINRAPVNSYSSGKQDFGGRTRTLAGSTVVTSFAGSNFNNDVLRQGAGNQASVQIQFNGANNGNPARAQQATTIAPEVTTFTGDYSRTRTRNQNNKVIVKLSDLHPLILGKLGAECTCKADPFAVFRGPNRKTLPINSQNKGPVDLANYDESDIYIEVDSAKEVEFLKNVPSNRLIKMSAANSDGVGVNSRGESKLSTLQPPTPYLPPSNEYLPALSESAFAPKPRTDQARQPFIIRVDENTANIGKFGSARGRVSKSLFNGAASRANSFQDKSFDRVEPDGSSSAEEALRGGLTCARPGLFRHPRFCNKFYACHWDDWKKSFTLHVFNCPVHLAFDTSAGACNYPSKGPACQDNKLLI